MPGPASCSCRVPCGAASPLACSLGHCASSLDGRCQLDTTTDACVCRAAGQTVSDANLDLLIIVSVPTAVALMLLVAFVTWPQAKGGMKHKID